MKRTIAVLTTSRADYSHLRWVLQDLHDHAAVDLRLVVSGAHLSGEFGLTLTEIERDGLPIAEKVECLLSSDTDVGMAKTIGVAALGLAEVFGRMRPDLLLLIADRYEMLAPASVALALRIPVAHIEGGEVSEGAIDDAVRNALTKLSHLHFTSTEGARQRVLAMGEEPWRVHRAGAPSLDHLRRSRLLSRVELEARLGRPVDPRAVLVACHPVTIERDTLHEADALFEALEELTEPILFSFPNADAGSRDLIRRARDFCSRRSCAELFVNLNPEEYWSLLRVVAAMLGNSSSGIMETPTVELPTVDIGLRQQGRERARNVLHAAASKDPILAAVRRALDPGFRESLRGLQNPYGDGKASGRIRDVLVGAPPARILLHKRALPVDPRWGAIPPDSGP